MAVLLLGEVSAVEVQSGPTLSALTVPGEVLPGGCALEQPEPKPAPTPRSGRTVVRGGKWFPFPTNPWSGSDRKLVTEVRRVIDGTPRLPDGPPLDAADAGVFLLKLADNVVEAYHAVYASADNSGVGVWAVRFNDEALAKPERPPGVMTPPRGFSSRFVQGATVVVVTASSSNECVRAIDRYLRSRR